VIPSSFSTARKTPREGRFSLTRPFGALALGLLLFSWLTTEHIPPWVTWHAEATTFAAVWLLALGAVGTDLRLEGKAAPQIALPALAAPLLAFGLVVLLQYIFGAVEFGGDALVVWAYLLLAALALAAGYRAAKARPANDAEGLSEPLEWLAWTLLLGAGTSTAIAFAQVFELWGGSGWVYPTAYRRPGGNLAQPNHLAILLLMGMASTLVLNRRGRYSVAACALVLAFLALGLAITESRAGFIGFSVLLGWWWVARRRVFPDMPAWFGVAAAAFYAMCFLWRPEVLAALQLAPDSSSSRLGQPGLRLLLWQQMADAVLLRPWFGWGVLGVAEAHNAVAHRTIVSDALSYAHSIILDLAVWIGIPLTLAFLVVALRWAGRRLMAPQSAATWFGLALAMPLAVNSLVEYPYAYAYLLVPAGLALGYVEGVRGAQPWLRLGARSALALLLASGAVLLWSAWEYVEIEDDFRVVRFEQLKLGRTPDDHAVPRVVLLTQLGALLTGSRIDLRPGMTPDELAAVRGLAMRYPWPATQMRYALASALNGDPGEAYRQMEVIRAQRGERLYRRVKEHFVELAGTRHPQLQGLKLP
jgi:O-antigen ligase